MAKAHSATKASPQKPIDKPIALEAFRRLDELLKPKVTLYMGGGTCMILAHDYPLATSDVDALPKQVSFEEIEDSVKKVAQELGLPSDWLNPYFSSFTHVLPSDFHTRLIRVFEGRQLVVEALGREDMLIMKCFAHREKDLGHARALVKKGVDLKLVERAIEEARDRGLRGAEKALDFLDELLSEMDG